MMKQLKEDQKSYNQSVCHIRSKKMLVKKNCKKTQEVFEQARNNLLLQKGVSKQLKTLIELQANWEQ